MKIIINNNAWFKKSCIPITDLTECEEICKALKETLDNHPDGCGLAANQIGFNKRIALLRYDGNDIMLINPVILDKSPNKVKSIEGCLSYPGKQATVKRHESIMVTSDNHVEPREFTGMLSFICQHEMDHLNGKLCFESKSNGSNKTPKKKKRKKR